VAASDYNKVSGRYYLRFNVADQPSVLAEIAGVLGKQNISIASVIQHEAEEGSAGVVPLVIMTHQATEGDMRRAIAAIDRLSFLRGRSVRMRVRE
jgi:homoserine dehydrogenase